MDSPETTEAVRRLLEGFDPEPATTRRAIAYVLRLPGDDDSVRRADELHPLQIGESWNIAQAFCDVDPYDPEAPPPTDLSRAQEAVANISPDQTWVEMGHTPEQHELEHAIPPLARFEPDTIVSALRSVTATVRSRSGFPLRQLAFRLPALSVILEGESLQSVRERLDSILERPDDASPDDLHWILLNLTATLLPHLSTADQIHRLHVLPRDMPPFYDLGDALIPIEPGVLERYLVDAITVDDDRGLLWLLFHASCSRSTPTDRVRAEVVRLFTRSDDLLGMVAASYISQCEDSHLDHALVDECLRSMCPDSRYHRRALAEAVVRSSRTDAVHLVPREFIGYVAHVLGGDAPILFGEFIDRTVKRGLDLTEPTAREQVELHLNTTVNGLELLRWGDERREPDLGEFVRDSATPEGARLWSARQERLRQAITVFEQELAAADAEYLGWAPPLLGLTALVRRVPDQVRTWSKSILEAIRPKQLSQVRNLGLAIASACGHSDPTLAAAVFRKLASARSVLNVRVDGLDLYTFALFSAGDGAEIDTLRGRSSNTLRTIRRSRQSYWPLSGARRLG